MATGGSNVTCIDDKYETVDELMEALRNVGLESSNLIIGIDFTKSNEWTGKYSFGGESLHAISPNKQNPYEHAIDIIGDTLLQYDEDKLIPCFGFGDLATHDKKVFSFYQDGRPCKGIDGVLDRYRQLVPYLNLSGPTSYAPIIRAAIDVVKETGGQYHILIIIADGQVTGNIGGNNAMLSIQEKATIDAIVEASNYPLSIVLVGVGDGPWNTMHHFDNAIPKRRFDNFQFVNYTSHMNKTFQSREENEDTFILDAFQEIPDQYREIKCLPQISLGRHTCGCGLVLKSPIP